jgi:hypothetical protein
VSPRIDIDYYFFHAGFKEHSTDADRIIEVEAFREIVEWLDTRQDQKPVSRSSPQMITLKAVVAHPVVQSRQQQEKSSLPPGHHLGQFQRSLASPLLHIQQSRHRLDTNLVLFTSREPLKCFLRELFKRYAYSGPALEIRLMLGVMEFRLDGWRHELHDTKPVLSLFGLFGVRHRALTSHSQLQSQSNQKLMHGRLTRTVAGAARDGDNSEVGGRGDDRRGCGLRKRLKVG